MPADATFPPVDDRSIVATMLGDRTAGGSVGLEQAYRRYADRLYAYCRSLLHDGEGAADAVQDTFVVANQRIGDLRDPDRLSAWLYAIARNECLRQLRQRRRSAALEEAGEVPADVTDPGTAVNAAQVRELVHAAAQGLNPGDREVIELAVRHGLAPVDLGAVLGVSANHAHARLSRARTQLERALGALLVARTGARDCPTLGELLAGWDGHLTALLRKRVARHVESCPVCTARQAEQFNPAALLAAWAGLPFAAVAVELWPRLRLVCQSSEYERLRVERARRAGKFNPQTGFPYPLDQVRRRLRAAWLPGAAAMIALLVGVGTAMFMYNENPIADALPPVAPSTGTSESPAGGGALVASPSGSRSPRPSPSTATPRSPSNSPSRSTSPSPPPPEPPPFAVSATAEATCVGKGYFQLTVTAVASHGTPKGGTLVASAGTPRTQALKFTGQNGAATVLRVPTGRVTWQVVVTATDGQSAQAGGTKSLRC